MAVCHSGDVFARLSFHKVLAEAVSGRMDGLISGAELGAGEEPLAAIVLRREAYDAHFAAVIAEAAGERDLPAGRDTTMLGRPSSRCWTDRSDGTAQDAVGDRPAGTH